MLKVIRTLAELEQYTAALQQVYQRNSTLLFMSAIYVRESYAMLLDQNKSNSLFCVLYFEQEQLQHYIPLYIDCKGVLRFIFDRHTDYCALVGQHGGFLFFKSLAQLFLNEKSIRKIDLDNLSGADDMLGYLKHFLGNGCQVCAYNNHSFLSARSGSFLGQLSTKARNELKRLKKRNSDSDFRVYDGQLPFPDTDLRTLRTTMIQKKLRTEAFMGPGFLSMCAKLYQNGELEVFTKWDKQGMIAASIVLVNTNAERMVWLDLYDEVQYISISAYIDYIEHLERIAAPFLSFGRGSYDFKTKNFEPVIQNLYNLRYSRSAYDWWFVNYHPFRMFVKRILKR